VQLVVELPQIAQLSPQLSQDFDASTRTVSSGHWDTHNPLLL